MILQASELFDEAGVIVSTCARWLSGYQRVKAPLSGLKLIQQTLQISQPVTIQEHISAGVYFTFNTAHSEHHTDEVTAIQVQPVFQDSVVDWEVAQPKNFAWIQLFISWEQLATVTGEPVAQAQSFFARHVGQETGASLALPQTQALSKDLHHLLAQEGKQLALIGKLYSVIFQFIEHIQIRSHLAKCEGCQKKLFNSQNLLESDTKYSAQQLAKEVGLTLTALELGFPIIANMTVPEYQIEVAIRKALSQQGSGVSLAKRINADTGLAKQDIEKACLKRFGVLSHQLGSMQ
ncbi:hypothetical protein [Marinomonas ostreistagni]|uniref:hypothetical protein n=1 Tax=Marinomonas ostreistagni TaxID=359209 RepID=UPI00195238BE|nr:hypothetical protein [Marinomonas ostreistagni]MBM6550495.1 hypothetical protein [Marinomonas ostreistagni]